MVDILSVTVCAIFGACLLLSLCILAKHLARLGTNHGVYKKWLGWIFLSMFCSLRVVNESLWITISHRDASTMIFILALLPLQLAAAWILCEVYFIHEEMNNDSSIWLFMWAFHIMVVLVGTFTAIAGAAGLVGGEGPASTSVKVRTLIGFAFWAICCVVLVVVNCILAFRLQRARNAGRIVDVLLVSICFASMLVFVRVCYAATALGTREAYLDPTTGSLAVRVGLAAVPDIILTFVYVAVGLAI